MSSIWEKKKTADNCLFHSEKYQCITQEKKNDAILRQNCYFGLLFCNDNIAFLNKALQLCLYYSAGTKYQFLFPDEQDLIKCFITNLTFKATKVGMCHGQDLHFIKTRVFS